ncbi:MAG TPA: N-acetylmuramoyl-L-alanine amidase [Anaeromyxobacter sp.]
MGRRALALTILLSVAAPGAAGAGAQRGAAPRPATRGAAAKPVRSHPRPARAPTLADARAAMTALMRDRSRRRYHHQWERAIHALLRAARGKDAPAAYLEAARARYALYRWSANEADREAALSLAGRATRAGSRDAPVLARAIRREAGEPAEERTTSSVPKRGARARAVRPERAEPAEPAADDESPPDPALEAALADLSPSAAPAHPLGTSGGEGPARVSEVRSWASEDYTRVAVYLSHWVGWQKLDLAPAPGHPRRIALDLRPAVLEGAALARPVAGEQVDRVRAAQNGPDTVRVVLELPGADGVQIFALDDPPRLVLDIGARRQRQATASPTPTSAHPERSAAEGGAESKGTPAVTSAHAERSAAEGGAESKGTATAGGDDGAEEAPATIRRIVVDAGHGGHDPGAIGPRRVREKDVTLATARRLAKKLREAGFEVVLTRKDDRFIALEERTAIANTARGDLFVSVHANAHPRRNRAGVETYYLNTADNRYAARLAARENGLDLGDGEGEVARILTDLGAKASAGASQRLARMVQREVTTGVRARIGEVRDLGVKSALFYVLLGARMPAVLVETAFISNGDEERRLASARYQEEVASGIARAVSAFARSGDRVAAR